MEGYEERITANYENLSKKYAEIKSEYNKQYCSIYLARLKEMETLLLNGIATKWNDKYPICKLHKLAEEKKDKFVVIGTIFKDQKLKPSILKLLSEANQLTPQPILTQFTDESDKLFIEDEVQRYQLIGCINGDNFITGVTAAFLGTDVGNGKFSVDEYIFAGYRPQIERPLIKEDIFVVFLSGLDLLHHQNFVPNLQLFTYWLRGMLGDIDTVKNVTRVIIAGNSVKKAKFAQKPSISLTSRVPEPTEAIEAVKTLDYFTLELCELIDVDLMPGEFDPSNRILPQKPMHFCMFPESATYKSFNPVSNPYCCSVEGVTFLGTSGQNVSDILNFTNVSDPLEALELCLKWNHLAPSAPDTLGCFPFYENDPFILEDCPHVLFVGNQKKFDTKIVTGENNQEVRLISIPEFSSTFQAVMLNLKNLETTSIVFNT